MKLRNYRLVEDLQGNYIRWRIYRKELNRIWAVANKVREEVQSKKLIKFFRFASVKKTSKAKQYYKELRFYHWWYCGSCCYTAIDKRGSRLVLPDDFMLKHRQVQQAISDNDLLVKLMDEFLQPHR